MILEEGRAHRGANALRVDEVFEAYGNAVKGSPVRAGPQLLLGPSGLFQRPLRRDGYKGVGLVALDAPEKCPRDLDRGEEILPVCAGEGCEACGYVLHGS